MNKRCLFPNFFTMLNLFCGFLAMTFIVHAMTSGEQGQAWFNWAALTICLAALCDALDGRIARVLGATTPFGKQLDSLADVVSFGAAPALLVYVHVFRDQGFDSIWMGGVASLFVCCGAARLARYNTSTVSGRFFQGMPIPAAGLMITGVTIFPSRLNENLIALLVLLAAFLMISTLRYPNPEHILLDTFLPFRILFFILFAIAVINPAEWFFLLPVFYMVYGLGSNLVDALRPREVG